MQHVTIHSSKRSKTAKSSIDDRRIRYTHTKKGRHIVRFDGLVVMGVYDEQLALKEFDARCAALDESIAVDVTLRSSKQQEFQKRLIDSSAKLISPELFLVSGKHAIAWKDHTHVFQLKDTSVFVCFRNPMNVAHVGIAVIIEAGHRPHVIFRGWNDLDSFNDQLIESMSKYQKSSMNDLNSDF